MRLWSDEIDAMRPEARAVVAAGLEVGWPSFAGEAIRPRTSHDRARFSPRVVRPGLRRPSRRRRRP